MTFAEFSEVFAVLALQLRATDADEAMARAYYRVLSDLDRELLQLAAERFAQDPSATNGWFPKTAEWRDMAGQIARERQIEQSNRLTALHRRGSFLCTECDDTGFAKRADGRFGRCACQDLRRMEIVGRRPLPALPSGDAA